MKLTDEEKAICERYGTRDEKGLVHCTECPLVVAPAVTSYLCRACAHYDPDMEMWVPDSWEVIEL